MESNPCFLLTVYKDPVDRRSPPIFWEKRAVEVQTSGRRDIQYGVRDKITVVKRENNVRRNLPDLFHPQGVIDILRGIDRDLPRGGKFGNGFKPDIFVRIVFMRKNRGNLETIPEKRFNAPASDGMIG
jgi:hypothetical protein